MTALSVNLIPKRVLVRRAQRGAIAAWIVVCAVAATIGGVVLSGRSGVLAAGTPQDNHQIEMLVGEQAETSREIAALEAAIARATAQLEGDRVAGQRIDWVILLALLDRASEGRAVLRSVTLVDGKEPGTKRVVIEGVSRQAAEAYEFVDALRATGVFSSMDLPDTRAEPQTGAVSFRVGAVIGGATP